jgi:drug/metabolite transporter (DMT)-like permease
MVGFGLPASGVLGIAWGSRGELGSLQNVGPASWGAGCVSILRLHAEGSWMDCTLRLFRCRVHDAHLPVSPSCRQVFTAPMGDVALAPSQGVLTAIISLLCYGRAVSILGASSGAAFAALCPAMTALLGIPILGEWPTLLDWTAISLISAGVYSVSGGPLPRLGELILVAKTLRVRG